MKIKISEMKLTHGRVISAILLPAILLSSLIIVSVEAIEFGDSSQNSVTGINESMNEKNEELDRLKSQMEMMNETSIKTQISDFSKTLQHIRNRLRGIEVSMSYAKYIKPKKLYFFTYMEEARYLYDKYIKYLKMDAYNTKICSLAHAVISNNKSELGDILRRIEEHVLPGAESLPYGNFFGPLRNAYMERDVYLCEQASIQQMIYEMYELLIQNEKIAYLVYKLSYSTLTKCSQGNNSENHSSELPNDEDTSFASRNYTAEMESAGKEIIRRIQKYRKLILIVIADLSREVRCEPWPYFRDEKFFEIERVVEPMSNNCRSTCDYFSGRTIHETTMYSRDNINITSCETCKSVHSSQLCRESARFPNGISKRNSSSYSLYRFFDVSLSCNNTLPKEEEEGYPHVHNYHRDDWVCKCTNPDVNIRHPYAMSLRPQESDIAENMIVTGIRFHKTGNPNGIEVIYPQIKVAKLSPEGLSEEQWKDVEESNDGSLPSGETGIDYAFFGTSENQSMIIKLDGNRGKPGYVVTGVKFQLRYDRYREKRYEGDIEKSFEILVRLTPCNFTTAHLSASESIYTDPDVEMVSAFDDDAKLKMPTRIFVRKTQEVHPMNGTNAKPDHMIPQYVEISLSGASNSSERRTTSYFDLFTVEPAPAFPLSAINLLFRDASWIREGVAFKAKTVNLTDLTDWQRYKTSNSI